MHFRGHIYASVCLSNSHVNNSLYCNPMASLWSCEWLPWNTIAVNWALFLGYHGYYDQFSGQMITKYYHSCHKQLSKATFPCLNTFIGNGFVSCIHLFTYHAVHFPFFTISVAAIIGTRACGSQRPYQWRNRLCDSAVFSLSSPSQFCENWGGGYVKLTVIESVQPVG